MVGWIQLKFGMEDVQCLTEKIAISVQSLLSRFLGNTRLPVMCGFP